MNYSRQQVPEGQHGKLSSSQRWRQEDNYNNNDLCVQKVKHTTAFSSETPIRNNRDSSKGNALSREIREGPPRGKCNDTYRKVTGNSASIGQGNIFDKHKSYEAIFPKIFQVYFLQCTWYMMWFTGYFYDTVSSSSLHLQHTPCQTSFFNHIKGLPQGHLRSRPLGPVHAISLCLHCFQFSFFKR